MKILHTADWHLGKRLEQFQRLEEQREVLDEICQIADRENVDVVIVAGDLFDTFNPSTEATELLYTTLHQLSNNGQRAVVAIAGNHDLPQRIDVPDALARACGILFVGLPNAPIQAFETNAGLKITKTDRGFVEIKLPNSATPLRLILTPYANETRLKTYLGVEKTEEALRDVLQKHWQTLADAHCDTAGVNILATHLYLMQRGGEMPEEPDDERPILHIGGAQAVFSDNVPPQMQYVALGHLHRFQTVATKPCPMVYSSSPLAYSFAEANQTKYVVVVQAEANEPVDYKAIELTKGKKLLRAKFDSVDQAVAWLTANPDAIVQITMQTDHYLESADKKRLVDAHPYLMPIVPALKLQPEGGTSRSMADLQGQSMEELFVSYFKTHKDSQGQAPSDSLLDLFREITALPDHDPN